MRQAALDVLFSLMELNAGALVVLKSSLPRRCWRRVGCFLVTKGKSVGYFIKRCS